MSHRVLTAHVPNTLARQVDAIAEKLDRPRGWVMQEALTLYVELERKRHELTLEGLADVDAGRTVEHAQIETWAASLPGRKRHRKR